MVRVTRALVVLADRDLDLLNIIRIYYEKTPIRKILIRMVFGEMNIYAFLDVETIS